MKGYELINGAARACSGQECGDTPPGVTMTINPIHGAEAAGRFRLFGLDVASELDLPELRPDPAATAEPDVSIRLGGLPDPGQPLVPLGENVEIASQAFRLKVPGVGNFLVRRGREIFVDPAPGAPLDDVRAYLLGSVMAGLVYQLELLPLHASSVAHQGRAAAFLGHSGAGKSTLAHRLSGRGYGLLSDDVCVVHGQASEPPLVFPGIRQFKLWEQSLSAAGESKAGLRPVLMRDDKYLLPTRRLAEDEPHALALIYVLARDEEAASCRIEPLKGSAAVNALVSNTYRGVALRRMQRSAWHLKRCAALAQRCRIFSLTMAWGFDRAEHSYDEIEAHMRHQLEGGT